MGVGDSSGVGVRDDVGVRSAPLVLVAPVVAVGDGVPVRVAVTPGVLVAVAVELGVGILVEEVMVGLDLEMGPRPHASRVARRAMAPAPVRKRRRFKPWRWDRFGGSERLSVMPPS